jgi:hypothetical protein
MKLPQLNLRDLIRKKTQADKSEKGLPAFRMWHRIFASKRILILVILDTSSRICPLPCPCHGFEHIHMDIHIVVNTGLLLSRRRP